MQISSKEARALINYLRSGQVDVDWDFVEFEAKLNSFINQFEDVPDVQIFQIPDPLAIKLGEACVKAVRLWGADLQSLVLMEELAELIRGISKFKRYGKDAIPDLKEEIADVIIMLRQFGEIIDYSDLHLFIERKVDRVLGWIHAQEPKEAVR